LASSLGAVELTLALHYLFDTPRDKIVWDVGHQAYGHKILTGRRDRFPTIRQYGGISGFPFVMKALTIHLTLLTPEPRFPGHWAWRGARSEGRGFSRGAVVGDAGLTTGVELEGINNLGREETGAGNSERQQDVDLSNVGAFAGYLNRIVHGQAYNRLREEVEKMIRAVPRLGPRC